MQVVRTEPSMIRLLTCGGCRHWQETTRVNTDGHPTGRCARFSETRNAEMRPRCNICWEPREALQIPSSIQGQVL